MKLEAVADLLNRFPEVTWDRCARGEYEAGGNYGAVFGWIPRADGRSDFLVVQWSLEDAWFTTSSAEYSREFDRRMRGTDEGHSDCERVERVFGDLVPRKVELVAA